MPAKQGILGSISESVSLLEFLHGRAGLLLSLLLVLALSQPDARAHGDERQPEPAFDTSAADVTAKVQAFTQALDSVYTSISGTYLGIEPILKKSCYDCHSDSTRYPWYYKIPGIHGMIDNDIREARKHLVLSNRFPFGGPHSPEEQLRGIKEEIEEGGMPIWMYRTMHWNRLIEGTAQDSVFQWIDSALASIRRVKIDYGIQDPEPPSSAQPESED